MAQEVESLRAFRDGYLMENVMGSVFVDSYYRLSPPIADYIAEHSVLRAVVRAVLVPVVWITQTVVAIPQVILGLILALGLLMALNRRSRSTVQ